jgi:hypothetical protein
MCSGKSRVSPKRGEALGSLAEVAEGNIVLHKVAIWHEPIEKFAYTADMTLRSRSLKGNGDNRKERDCWAPRPQYSHLDRGIAAKVLQYSGTRGRADQYQLLQVTYDYRRIQKRCRIREKLFQNTQESLFQTGNFCSGANRYSTLITMRLNCWYSGRKIQASSEMWQPDTQPPPWVTNKIGKVLRLCLCEEGCLPDHIKELDINNEWQNELNECVSSQP